MESERGGWAARLERLVPRALFDMGKVGSGMLLRNVLRGLFKLMLAAFLTPALMGVLRSVQAFFRITSSLIEFGLKYAMVTFVPAAIRRGDEDERDRLLMTSLGMMLMIIVVVILLGNLFAEPLAAWVLGDAGLTLYVRLAVLGACGRLLWQFVSAYMTAEQQFGRMALFLSTGPVAMIVVALALAASGRLDLLAATCLVLFAPTVTVVIWWPALDRRFIRLSAWSRATAARLARFSRWIYLTSFASALRGHLNPLLLKSPGLSGSVAQGEINAGLYGFGNDLANEMQMFSGAVTTVLIPKASRAGTPDGLRSFTRRCYRYVPLVVAGLLPLMFLAHPALVLLSHFSKTYLEYIPALRVFYILYVGGLFSIATIPMMTVLYAMNLPQIEARLEAAMIPILVVGGFVLIPRYGCEGAAWSILAQRVLAFVVIVGYGVNRLRTWQGDGSTQVPDDGDPSA